MNANGYHGGVTPAERLVPLYMFGHNGLLPEAGAGTLPQLLIAPLMCHCLGLAPSKAMTTEGLPPLVQI
ncbi:hypothetical protein D3C75_1274840 [compost metagenome]